MILQMCCNAQSHILQWLALYLQSELQQPDNHFTRPKVNLQYAMSHLTTFYNRQDLFEPNLYSIHCYSTIAWV